MNQNKSSQKHTEIAKKVTVDPSFLSRIWSKAVLNPKRQLYKRYSNESNQWVNHYAMWVYMFSDWFVIPIIFLTANSILTIGRLPENKYELMLGAFGITATIASLCRIKIREDLDETMEKVRVRFIMAAIIIFQMTALVFLDEYYSNTETKWLMPGVIPVIDFLITWAYSLFVGFAGLMWMSGFIKLNTFVWRYHYALNYIDKSSEDDQTES